MKRFFSQVMVALAFLCGAIFIASMFVALLCDDTNVIRTGCAMAWLSAGFGFLFAVAGQYLSE